MNQDDRFLNAINLLKDLKDFKDEIKKDLQDLKKEVGDLKKEVGDLKKEVGELQDLKKEFGDFKDEMKKEFGDFQDEMKKDFKDVKLISSQTQTNLGYVYERAAKSLITKSFGEDFGISLHISQISTFLEHLFGYNEEEEEKFYQIKDWIQVAINHYMKCALKALGRHTKKTDFTSIHDVENYCSNNQITLEKQDLETLKLAFRFLKKEEKVIQEDVDEALFSLLICYISKKYPNKNINPFRKDIEINCLGTVKRFPRTCVINMGEIKFSLNVGSRDKAIEQLEIFFLCCKTCLSILDPKVFVEGEGVIFYEKSNMKISDFIHSNLFKIRYYQVGKDF